MPVDSKYVLLQESSVVLAIFLIPLVEVTADLQFLDKGALLASTRRHPAKAIRDPSNACSTSSNTQRRRADVAARVFPWMRILLPVQIHWGSAYLHVISGSERAFGIPKEHHLVRLSLNFHL